MIHLTMKSMSPFGEFPILLSESELCPFLPWNETQWKGHNQIIFLTTEKRNKENKIIWKIEEKNMEYFLAAFFFAGLRWFRSDVKRVTRWNCLIINYGHCFGGLSAYFLIKNGRWTHSCAADFNFMFDIFQSSRESCQKKNKPI